MHTLVIEAGPAGAHRTFSVALEKLLAVVTEHVMLAWYKVDILRGRSFQYLIERIELAGLRELTRITSVNDEIWRVGHGIDLVDCRLQGSGNVRIGWFVKTDVTVADLDKSEVATFSGFAAAFGK